MTKQSIFSFSIAQNVRILRRLTEAQRRECRSDEGRFDDERSAGKSYPSGAKSKKDCHAPFHSARNDMFLLPHPQGNNFQFSIKKYRLLSKSVFSKIKPWQRAIFPSGLPLSIVTASSLYGRVRDGNGCFPAALSPEINLLVLHTGNCIIEVISI